MHKPIDKRITQARTRLLLDYPWFGSLAMRLRIEETESCQTFSVDGTTLRYNPQFAAGLTDPELTAVMAHEVLHCALLHPYRRGSREHELWNKAADYAINAELVKAGMTLPAGALLDPQYNGLAAEVIYARMSQKPQPQGDEGKQDPGDGDGQGDESPTGTVEDAPSPDPGQGEGDGQGDGQEESQGKSPAPMTETDWQIAAEQASTVGKAAGRLPGDVAEMVKAARTVPADWREILREFIAHTVPSDYSWTSPNRRHVAHGLYLPGVRKENMGVIAVAVDTSASIDSRMLSAFSSEINSIVQECHPEMVKVLYCDAHVHKTEEHTEDEEIQLEAIGRGGTAFQPVFDEIATWDESPACLIYMTDLDSSDVPKQPEYPVLWAVDFAQWHGKEPFGQVVEIVTGV